MNNTHVKNKKNTRDNRDMKSIKVSKDVKNAKNIYINIDSFYNNAKSSIEKKINVDANFDFEFDNNIVKLYLGNKLKFKGEYNILGIYNIESSVWYWSWGISFINKALTNQVVKIKEFSKELEDNYGQFDALEAEQLYYLISNNNFYISNINIDKIIKLGMFLTNGIWIFPYKKNKNDSDGKQFDTIEYILITKILQFN